MDGDILVTLKVPSPQVVGGPRVALRFQAMDHSNVLRIELPPKVQTIHLENEEIAV